MSNCAARLIALALLIFTGGILLGTGTIAAALNSNRSEAQMPGYLLMLLGGIGFVIEYIVSIKRQE